VGTNNTGTDAAVPQPVGTGTDWKTTTAGNFHSCAIRSTGRLYCWGSNPVGELGTNNTGTNAPVPNRVILIAE